MAWPKLSPTLYACGLFAITLAAWGLRLYMIHRFIGLSATLDPADGLDELDYEQFAYQMSVGNGYVLEDGTPTARRAPGTSLLLLPIYLVFGRVLVAARVWMVLMSALNCAAAAWVVRPRCGPAAALLTAAAMAVNPGLFYYAVHLWSEAPFCLAITLATGCMLRAAEQNSRRWSVFAGVCWGAAVLIRPQILFLAPCVLVAAIWTRPAERKLWFRELLCESLVVAAIIVPWVGRNWLVIGKPTLNTIVGGQTFWGAHNGTTFREDRFRGLWKPYFYDPGVTFPLSGDEVAQNQQAWNNGWICVSQYQSELPRLVAWKVYRLFTPFEETPNRMVYWSFALTWIASIPLVLVGLIRLRQIDPRLLVWMLLNFAAVLLSTLIFYGAARFRHAVEPLLMMAAGVGAAFLLARLFRLEQRPVSRSA